jgi:hypothetical protein
MASPRRWRLSFMPRLRGFRQIKSKPISSMTICRLRRCRVLGPEKAKSVPAAKFIESRAKGATHFLKMLPKVATEMALSVLTYNLTRVLNIVGMPAVLEAIKG